MSGTGDHDDHVHGDHDHDDHDHGDHEKDGGHEEVFYEGLDEDFAETGFGGDGLRRGRVPQDRRTPNRTVSRVD
ncbi:MAG: hypothetical protein ACRYF3_13060, partial [Janthinobacterium lividum]